MKKEYTKPGIIIESFEIAQNISAGCGAIPGKNVGGMVNSSQAGVCGWKDTGSRNIIWVGTTSNCTTDTPADSEIYLFCYNNPDSSKMRLFSS